MSHTTFLTRRLLQYALFSVSGLPNTTTSTQTTPNTTHSTANGSGISTEANAVITIILLFISAGAIFAAVFVLRHCTFFPEEREEESVEKKRSTKRTDFEAKKKDAVVDAVTRDYDQVKHGKTRKGK